MSTPYINCGNIISDDDIFRLLITSLGSNVAVMGQLKSGGTKYSFNCASYQSNSDLFRQMILADPFSINLIQIN